MYSTKFMLSCLLVFGLISVKIHVSILPLVPVFCEQVSGGSLQKGFLALRNFCFNESRQHFSLATEMKSEVQYSTNIFDIRFVDTS